MARKKSEQASMYLTAATTLEHLGADVKAQRTKRGLTLRAAGEQMGVAWTTLHHVESGEHSPRTDLAVKMLRWLATA